MKSGNNKKVLPCGVPPAREVIETTYFGAGRRGAKEDGGCGEAAQATADAYVPIIYAFRIGCLLHVLHLAISAGMQTDSFMGPLGTGSWHEWPKQHLVSLLGSVWYNTSTRALAATLWRRSII